MCSGVIYVQLASVPSPGDWHPAPEFGPWDRGHPIRIERGSIFVFPVTHYGTSKGCVRHLHGRERPGWSVTHPRPSQRLQLSAGSNIGPRFHE